MDKCVVGVLGELMRVGRWLGSYALQMYSPADPGTIENPYPSWDDEDMGAILRNESTEIIEYGLQLPTGEVVWGEYHDRPVGTPGERSTMVEVLRLTARDCGFAEEDFLKNYRWAVRVRTVTLSPITTYAITHDQMVAAATDPGEDDTAPEEGENIEELVSLNGEVPSP